MQWQSSTTTTTISTISTISSRTTMAADTMATRSTEWWPQPLMVTGTTSQTVSTRTTTEGEEEGEGAIIRSTTLLPTITPVWTEGSTSSS